MRPKETFMCLSNEVLASEKCANSLKIQTRLFWHKLMITFAEFQMFWILEQFGKASPNPTDS